MKNWIIGFFILQIGFDLAHSVTALPFVHYGMFSQSFVRPDSIIVFRVSVDGRPLQQRDFTVYHWDMVQGPLEAAEKRAATNDFAFDRGKMRAALGSLYKDFSPNLENTGDFVPWYKGYLGRLLGRPISVLRVDKAWYRWSGGRMQLIQTENWING
jgi:hypothetical protein